MTYTRIFPLCLSRYLHQQDQKRIGEIERARNSFYRLIMKRVICP